MENIISIKNLIVSVQDKDKKRRILDDISVDIKKDTITALVGESGSGKTTCALSILRLLSDALKIESGTLEFESQPLLKLSLKQMQNIRGKEIGMVFQEPLNAFNPLFTISFQINEVLQYHTNLNKKQRQARVLELLDVVGIEDVVRVSKNYPHQLSGGMRQRAMIAVAIASNPKLLIADEPTSNLDVTLQARIIELFKDLKVKLNFSIILITHDLGLVEHLADEAIVMKEGKIVEKASVVELLNNPQQQYTKELLNAIK
ncbi:MAG: ABC transporter ATP-binding protein [Candidatus Zapsychrus exili]|nr:ABC transporter ATP-binding protein [Candidatus Zapsychrus exili]